MTTALGAAVRALACHHGVHHWDVDPHLAAWEAVVVYDARRGANRLLGIPTVCTRCGVTRVHHPGWPFAP